MKYSISGFFRNIIFESSDGNKNIYGFTVIHGDGSIATIPSVVVTKIRQDVSGELVTVTGKVVNHPKYGVNLEATKIEPYIPDSNNVPKPKSYKPKSGTQQNTDVPPQLPKEYYDSMLEAYQHEEERVRDI